MQKGYISTQNKKRIKIKQKTSREVNKLDTQVEYSTETQKKHLRTICSNFKNLFGDPDEKLTYTTRVETTLRSTNESPYTQDTTRTQRLLDQK